MAQREKQFRPGEPIYAGDMNKIIHDTYHWTKTVDAGRNYLTNVAGIECIGNINVHGTFLINGTPLMAFRPVPEKIIERTVVPVINERVIQREAGVSVIAGDIVTIEPTSEGVIIHADPGDWVEYQPHQAAKGQYIVYGPICHIQMHVDRNEFKEALKLMLPFPSYGNIRQSLDGYPILERAITVDPQRPHEISGTYRIA
jgi:hypothetical protein